MWWHSISIHCIGIRIAVISACYGMPSSIGRRFLADRREAGMIEAGEWLENGLRADWPRKTSKGEVRTRPTRGILTVDRNKHIASKKEGQTQRKILQVRHAGDIVEGGCPWLICKQLLPIRDGKVYCRDAAIISHEDSSLLQRRTRAV